MPKLSDHDLKQMDAAWQDAQPVPVVRSLLARALDDLRVARDRLNQNPNNSSRPSGSMPPWARTGVAGAIDQHLTAPDEAPDYPDHPKASPPDSAPDAPAPAPAAPADSANPTTPDEAPQEPAVAQATQVTPAGRPGRRVGAPGHGRMQKLAVTRVQERHPEHCAGCLLPLIPDASAQAWCGWDTLDLVPLSEPSEEASSKRLGLRVEVTRHRLMQQSCCACGHLTQAQPLRAQDDSAWPGVRISEQRLLGPRLAATVVYLCVRMRLPRRKVQELLLELFELELSSALISQTLSQTARSAAPLEAQLRSQLEQAVLLHADETSWMEGAQALWLWVLCCSHTVMYFIGWRSKEMFENALGADFAGFLMTDGYSVYRSWVNRLRCWAHLVRKLRGIAQSTDRVAAQAGAAMLKEFEGLMRAVYEARGSPLGAAAQTPAQTHDGQVQRLRQLCQQHSSASHKALGQVAREFLNDWDAIMRVLSEPWLPLTNNAAERWLRHYVIARGISYGTRNQVGSDSLATLASVIDTCRIRGGRITDLLARAIHAARMGLPAPDMPPIPPHLLGREGALVGL